MPADIIVPSWLDDRDISHAEIVKATDIPQTTIVNWGRIVRASGVEFGKQFRGDWFYSARELYAFSIATALGHIPINGIPKVLLL